MLRFSRRHADSTPADSEDATSNVADEDKTSASPASRLRAALHRMGPSTPPQRRTASFSESDSDLNPAFSARKSLKDVFSRAMRDSSDDLGAKNSSSKLNLGSDREERDDSQLSDSSLPLSSQAASLNLLRQRLDLPETSSRFETSHSTVKTSHHQDLKHLLDRANGEGDISTDTAKASFSQNGVDDDQATASPPARHSPSLSATSPNTPRRRQDSAGVSGSKNTDGDDGAASLDDDAGQQTAGRTPRPPGGWSTPSRANGYSVDPDTPVGRTPAPPGAWKNTPVSERKGILKVRFDENAKDHTDNLAQGSQTSLQEPLSDIDDEPGVARAVRLVDSFGRERRFDEDGQEIELPQPTSLANELASSRRTASVRLVDSMGNELDPSAISPDNTSSDFGDADGNDLVARIASKVSGARKTFDSIESRETVQRTRRTIKQQAIPHDRILELAMESRAARIERERLLRQSHLVRAREEALSKEAKKLEASPAIPTSFVTVVQPAGFSKWLILTVFLLHIILVWILYKCARAYIRHYFLTSYYDPFFPIVDPTPLQQLPFVRYTFLPSRWRAFTAHHTGQILFSLMNRLDQVNRHLLSLVSKPLMDVVDLRLPS